MSPEQAESFREQLGKLQIEQNPEVFGEILYRPWTDAKTT